MVSVFAPSLFNPSVILNCCPFPPTLSTLPPYLSTNMSSPTTSEAPATTVAPPHPPSSVPSNGPSPEALARLNQFKLDNFSLLETDFNRVSLERALLEQENKALKAEMSQIDFLKTPQDSFDMELQRLQQIAYAKYTALAKTSNNKSETDRALLESSALCAAKQTYHAFIDHPEELDGW